MISGGFKGIRDYALSALKIGDRDRLKQAQSDLLEFRARCYPSTKTDMEIDELLKKVEKELRK